MIECYGASRPQEGRSGNEDAFVIGRDLPYAAVFDGAGHAERAARRALRFFRLLVADRRAELGDPAAWARWVRLMDSHLMGGGESTFVGVAVPDEASGTVVGAYAGDSRAYLVGEQGAQLLTASSLPARLGSGRALAGTIAATLRPHDVLVLMSDGAWAPLSSPFLLQQAVARAATLHFADMPESILEAAGRAGRQDDMTVLVLRRRSGREVPW